MSRRIVGMLAILAGACGDPTVSQVIVIVDADDQVRSQSASLELRVVGGGRERMDLANCAAGASCEVHLEQLPIDDLPTGGLRLALAPDQHDWRRLYEVTATAYAGPNATGAVVAQARVVSGYVKGETRTIRLLLQGACIGRVCDPSQTCRDGACVDPFVAPETLRPLVPPDAGSDAGSDAASPDASADAGFDAGSDAALPDAGSDAAPLDAGSDAARPDAGSDAGVTDSGSPDAGVTDAGDGARDAGFDAGFDAGSDAARPDAGSDAGLTDSGSPDAGFDAGSDAAPPDAGSDAGSGPKRDAGGPGLPDGSLEISEVCDNGSDDDFDGAIDCADSDCMDWPGCMGSGM